MEVEVRWRSKVEVVRRPARTALMRSSIPSSVMPFEPTERDMICELPDIRCSAIASTPASARRLPLRKSVVHLPSTEMTISMFLTSSCLFERLRVLSFFSVASRTTAWTAASWSEGHRTCPTSST